MAMVTLKDAQAKLAELLDEAAKGKEVVIAKEDGSTFRIVPTAQVGHKKGRGLVGSAKGKVWMANDFDETPEGFEDYMS
jgi:prevent-host-death family protein